MWQAVVFGFLGGVLGANGFPHFTRGIRPAGAGRTAALGPRPRRAAGRSRGPLFQYVMPGNCSRARSSWPVRSRGQPKARAAWPLMSAAAAPLVKWTYSPQFIGRV